MIDEQNQYRNRINKITKMRIPKTLKIQMLHGLKELLKQSNQIKAIVKITSKNNMSTSATQNKQTCKLTQNLSTKLSLSESMSIDTMLIINQRDIEELQQNILHKKIFKIQNYQQIQILQQELYIAEDMVESKRKQNDYLRKRIDQKMIDIQFQKELQAQYFQKKGKPIITTPQRSKSASKQTSRSHNKSFSDYIKSFWW